VQEAVDILMFDAHEHIYLYLRLSSYFSDTRDTRLTSECVHRFEVLDSNCLIP